MSIQCQDVDAGSEDQRAKTLHQAGAAAHRDGRHDEAAALFRLAAALEPAVARHWSLLGCALRRGRAESAAVAGYRRAALLRPDYPAALYYRGVTEQTRDDDRAAGCMRAVLVLQPDHAEALFRFGFELWRRGEAAPARDAWRRAAAVDRAAAGRAAADLAPLAAQRCGLAAAAAVYRAWAADAKPIARMLGGAPLSRDQLRNMIEARQQAWRAGETPPPPRAGVYDVAPAATLVNGGRPWRIAVVGAGRIRNSRQCVDNDLTYHLAASARHLGLDVASFATDEIVHHFHRLPAPAFTAATARLLAQIASNRPDVILFEGGFIESDRTLSRAFWRKVKACCGARLITVISDWRDDLPDYGGHWAAVSDAILAFDATSAHAARLIEAATVLPAAGLPFDPALFGGKAAAAPRSVSRLFVGSNTRLRAVWLAALTEAGLGGDYRLHDRAAADSPPPAEYAALFADAKMTLNSGQTPDGRGVVTGRVFEAVLSGSLLLEQRQQAIDELFVPYVHYVPFDGAADLIPLCRFFEENDGLRATLAQAGADWARERYGAERFWRWALNQRERTLGA